MIDHFIDWILRIIGQLVRAVTKEKVREEVCESVVETILDKGIEKLSPENLKAEAKPSENFQELIASFSQDGIGLLALLMLLFAIVVGTFALLTNLIGDRFFFHGGNIIYLAEGVFVFFFAIFVPSLIVGKAAPLFLKIPSRKVRGWLAGISFLILFIIFYRLINSLFPGLSEVIEKHLR